MTLSAGVSKRFFSKVSKSGPVVRPELGCCWVWTAGKFRHGYGQFRLDGRAQLAHRVSWELTHGPVPSGPGYHGTCVLHRCDQPLCVNPAHLFLGTQADNMADMVAKGRCAGAQGERHGRAKLTAGRVKALRMLAALHRVSQDQLALLFGVDRAQVSRIVNRKAWRHI